MCVCVCVCVCEEVRDWALQGTTQRKLPDPLPLVLGLPRDEISPLLLSSVLLVGCLLPLSPWRPHTPPPTLLPHLLSLLLCVAPCLGLFPEALRAPPCLFTGAFPPGPHQPGKASSRRSKQGGGALETMLSSSWIPRQQ